MFGFGQMQGKEQKKKELIFHELFMFCSQFRAAIDKRALEKKQNEKRIESAGYQKELETILEKEKQPQPTPLQNLQQFAQQQQQNKSSRN